MRSVRCTYWQCICLNSLGSHDQKWLCNGVSINPVTGSPSAGLADLSLEAMRGGGEEAEVEVVEENLELNTAFVEKGTMPIESSSGSQVYEWSVFSKDSIENAEETNAENANPNTEVCASLEASILCP